MPPKCWVSREIFEFILLQSLRKSALKNPALGQRGRVKISSNYLQHCIQTSTKKQHCILFPQAIFPITVQPVFSTTFRWTFQLPRSDSKCCSNGLQGIEIPKRHGQKKVLPFLFLIQYSWSISFCLSGSRLDSPLYRGPKAPSMYYLSERFRNQNDPKGPHEYTYRREAIPGLLTDSSFLC